MNKWLWTIPVSSAGDTAFADCRICDCVRFCSKHLERRRRIPRITRESLQDARLILLRADSGFTRDGLMTWCEGNRVGYVFGLARNAPGRRHADELAAAETESLASGRPARRFVDFAWRTLDTWSRDRRVVAKAVRGKVGTPVRSIGALQRHSRSS